MQYTFKDLEEVISSSVYTLRYRQVTDSSWIQPAPASTRQLDNACSDIKFCMDELERIACVPWVGGLDYC